jgi:DNA-binding CsgD family transcriptional regulator
VPWHSGIDTSVRVAIVDENDIFRRGLVACIEADPALEVVFEGSTGPVTGYPDTAIGSVTFTRNESIQCPVLVCTDDPGTVEHRPSSNRIVAVLPRGTLTERQLVAAVRAAAAGLCVDVASDSGHSPEERPFPERCTEVLRLLAEGAGTREISESVGYSERTVKSVIQEIQRKLGARSRAQAVAHAIRRGVILVCVLAITLRPAQLLVR